MFVTVKKQMQSYLVEKLRLGFNLGQSIPVSVGLFTRANEIFIKNSRIAPLVLDTNQVLGSLSLPCRCYHFEWLVL